jgi:hypothetical protein
VLSAEPDSAASQGKRTPTLFRDEQLVIFQAHPGSRRGEVKTIREELCMGRLGRLLLASTLIIPLFGTGCAEHRRVYAWGPGETIYYGQWEHDTHRQHIDYERRSAAEQKQYWNWRHHHHD